jgi:hypothetical protein
MLRRGVNRNSNFYDEHISVSKSIFVVGDAGNLQSKKLRFLAIQSAMRL